MGKFIAKNIKITKDLVVATGEPFLDVTADIYEDDQLVKVMKYGFAFGTPTENIKTEIAKSLSTMKLEIKQAEENKDRDALEKQADEAIEEITDLEISEPVN